MELLGFWEILGGWVAAGVTLLIFSFLYRDNPLYRFAEHLYIGVSLGYSLVITIFKFLEPKLFNALFMEGKIHLIIPTILGILILTRIIPKLAWISRYSFAFVMGYGAGLGIPRMIHSLLLTHAEKTVSPLHATEAEKNAVLEGKLSPESLVFANLWELIIVIGVLSVLVYFFFSIEHKGPIRSISRLGILFLMVFLGSSYGATVMGRLALLSKRVDTLEKFSTYSYYSATWILLVLIVGFLLLYTIHTIRAMKKSTPK